MQRITKISRAKIVYPRFKMFQTKKYKLNLVEPSDTFSPDALNANTQKVEDVLSENLGGMDARVTVLEAHKFACGTYEGNSNAYGVPQFIELGFTPKGVIIWYFHNQPIAAVHMADGTGSTDMELVENGFSIGRYNSTGTRYAYFAFA